MRFTASKLVMAGWCAAATLLGVCAVLVLLPRTRADWGLPLFFWTLVGLLLLVATAAAVGLPRDKAGPWRTLLVALLACRLYYNPVLGENLFYRLLGFLTQSWYRPLIARIRDNAWDRSVMQMLVYLAIAGAAALIARLTTRREPLAVGFLRFRILHLFAFSTFVALTCMALRYASPPIADVVFFTLLGLRLTAAVCVGAGRGNSLFIWGFLFGSYSWEYFVDHGQFAAEWDEWLPRSLLQDRPDWPVEYQYYLLMALLPLYAGILTGVLAALFYQRAERLAANDKGHAEA